MGYRGSPTCRPRMLWVYPRDPGCLSYALTQTHTQKHKRPGWWGRKEPPFSPGRCSCAGPLLGTGSPRPARSLLCFLV